MAVQTTFRIGYRCKRCGDLFPQNDRGNLHKHHFICYGDCNISFEEMLDDFEVVMPTLKKK